MTDLYQVSISEIQGRCVSISVEGLKPFGRGLGGTKAFYLMILREAAEDKDYISQQLGERNNMLDEEWLYRNLNSFIQYVKIGDYKCKIFFEGSYFPSI